MQARHPARSMQALIRLLDVMWLRTRISRDGVPLNRQRSAAVMSADAQEQYGRKMLHGFHAIRRLEH